MYNTSPGTTIPTRPMLPPSQASFDLSLAVTCTGPASSAYRIALTPAPANASLQKQKRRKKKSNKRDAAIPSSHRGRCTCRRGGEEGRNRVIPCCYYNVDAYRKTRIAEHRSAVSMAQLCLTGGRKGLVIRSIQCVCLYLYLSLACMERNSPYFQLFFT